MTMTMMMMQRIIESAHKTHDKTTNNNQLIQEKLEFDKRSPEPQLFLQPKRIEDDSRDVEMCDNKSESDEEDLNIEVDVENDETLCPVDLTRSKHHQERFGYERLKPSEESDYGGFKKLVKDDAVKTLSVKRAESVCSDISRSDSPRDESPSVVPHQNRRLAFSVENILDPNKFTGRQGVYSDGVCCWKPHQESLGSPEYEGSDAGMLGFFSG